MTASVSISINWHGPLSSPPPPRGVIVVRGGGSGYRGDNTEVAGGVAGGGFVGDDRGLDIEGEGVIGGGGRGGACPEGWASGSCPHALTQCDDSTLSMVLAFLYRVMARGVHEASAMCTGGEEDSPHPTTPPFTSVNPSCSCRTPCLAYICYSLFRKPLFFSYLMVCVPEA